MRAFRVLIVSSCTGDQVSEALWCEKKLHHNGCARRCALVFCPLRLSVFVARSLWISCGRVSVGRRLPDYWRRTTHVREPALADVFAPSILHALVIRASRYRLHPLSTNTLLGQLLWCYLSGVYHYSLLQNIAVIVTYEPTVIYAV